MHDTPAPELELTPDLLEYARAVALKEAPKHCGPRVCYEDAAQEAVLQLLHKPPRFDPSRSATAKTLVYTIVQRAVIKFATREGKKAGRLESFSEPSDATPETPPGPTEEQVRTHQFLTGAGPTKHEALQAVVDEILQYIDNEDSRALCLAVIECNGNMSEAARRLKLSEGTVRYRLKHVLGPKLMAAGFSSFSCGDMQ